MDSVFIYEEYADDTAWGERITEAYATKEAAEARLKEQVERFFSIPFGKIRDVQFYDDDTLTKDYVSFNDSGICHFWSVTEKKLKGLPKMKTFYKVTTSVDDNGKLECHLDGAIEAEVQPKNKYISTDRHDFYTDYFTTRSEAEKFVRESRYV